VPPVAIPGDQVLDRSYSLMLWVTLWSHILFIGCLRVVDGIVTYRGYSLYFRRGALGVCSPSAQPLYHRRRYFATVIPIYRRCRIRGTVRTLLIVERLTNTTVADVSLDWAFQRVPATNWIVRVWLFSHIDWVVSLANRGVCC